MTIEEAILNFYAAAADNQDSEQFYEENLQVAHWLEELQTLREGSSNLKQQIEIEKNKHVKIQYKNHEYTISQICSKLDELERKLSDAKFTIKWMMEDDS